MVYFAVQLFSYTAIITKKKLASRFLENYNVNLHVPSYFLENFTSQLLVIGIFFNSSVFTDFPFFLSCLLFIFIAQLICFDSHLYYLI